ncbi:cupin domain-containing protein [Mariniflexile soesokkakense]|uniref:Cupin domain-containing protein n=1 Tax=Mariniflexile soesokkakense TaxID=1343160 RepID=A0ABV0A9B5_9FLAO
MLCVIGVNAQLEPVKGGVYHWNELPVSISEDRASRKILEGVSPHFEYLKIHATTQFPGAKPSTEHANDDIEECILVKEGKMKVSFENESTVLEAGGVLLLMPKQMHSLQNIGDTNLTYYVMRYKSKKPINFERGQGNGGSLLLNVKDLVFRNTELGGATDYFNRPTSMCEKFEMHSTLLNVKGPSHAQHAHVDGEIFLVVSGNVEMTIDGKVYTGSAGDLFFVKPQLMHGIRNVADNPCKYFVFKWN